MFISRTCLFCVLDHDSSDSLMVSSGFAVGDPQPERPEGRSLAPRLCGRWSELVTSSSPSC